MRNFYTKVLALVAVAFSTASFAQSDLIITGAVDGDLTGGNPKAVELYVINDIPDLSIYGLGSANNGGGTDGEEYVFPADAATAGQFIYVATEVPLFTEFFGFAPTYGDVGAMAINGDDAVELFLNGVVVDVFGDINVDGTGTEWDYADSWAYRVSGTSASTTFNLADWIFAGAAGLDGETTNGTAANPWPIGTYSPENGGNGDDVTIAEIQETTDESGASPLVGQTVITSGIVTAAYEDGFWIQDGTGAWSGIFVRQDNPTPVQGDNVTVTATVQENFGLTRLNNVTEALVNSSGNDLPAATALSTADAGTEEYESVLISLTAVTATNVSLGFGEWLVNDGSGDYRVDDELYNANPELFVGYNLTGIAHYSFDNFKLLPRDAGDVSINAGATVLGLSLETDELLVSEEDGTITVFVNIINPTGLATTVDVVAAGGTAINGEHYNFTDPTSLTFPANSSESLSFSFDIIDDAEANEDRTIVFALQNANNDAAYGIETITITIDDNDAEIIITDIAIVAETNAEGVAINNGAEFTVAGIVYGVNMNGAGLSFTIVDQTGGIGLYSNAVVDGYTVTEGDSVVVTGTVNQFNGLTQLNPSAITLVSQGNELNEPITTTELGEDLESQLVRIECVTIENPGNWTNSGSGFTVSVTDGTNSYAMRVDNDVDLYSMAAPEGTFDLIGIVGQFDNSSPFLEGYQVLPRYAEDVVDTDCEITPSVPNDDCSGAADLSGISGGPENFPATSETYSNEGATTNNDPNPNDQELCWAGAPVVQQTVWFSFTGDGNFYHIETTDCGGGLDDYLDDTQIAVFTGTCDELVQFTCNEDLSLTNFAAAVDFLAIEGTEYFIMVDGFENETGQFCMEFTNLGPNSVSDARTFNFEVFPNPASDRLMVQSPIEVQGAVLYNVIGQETKAFTFSSSSRVELDVTDVQAGIYILRLQNGKEIATAKVVIE